VTFKLWRLLVRISWGRSWHLTVGDHRHVFMLAAGYVENLDGERFVNIIVGPICLDLGWIGDLPPEG